MYLKILWLQKQVCISARCFLVQVDKFPESLYHHKDNAIPIMICYEWMVSSIISVELTMA